MAADDARRVREAGWGPETETDRLRRWARETTFAERLAWLEEITTLGAGWGAVGADRHRSVTR